VEKRLERIPEDFTIYYKPPGEEKHQKLNEVLDNIHHRLNSFEDFLAGEECQE
jgi:hypothetical protein